MDDFITIAQLAQGFNVSEKVIRHAFKKLRKQNKLIEGEDYIRDELHFAYKIHPGRFAVHSTLFPSAPSVENLATHFATTGSNVDSKSATQDKEFDSKLDNKHDELGSKLGSQDSNRVAREEPVASTREESSKSEVFLERFLESKDEQVVNLKEHVADLRSQLAKKDEMLSQAHSMISSMQEGQDSARDLIKMLGERVVEFSRRELPSGSKDNNLGSHRATQPDDLGSQDEQSDTKSATTSADERASYA
jgi:hypothetical protein